MTLAQIRQAVRDNISEQSAGYWTDAELNRYIQRACDIHASECHSVEWTQALSSIGGVWEYPLSNDIGQVRNVRFKDNDTYHTLSVGGEGRLMDGFTSSDSTSLPRQYYIEGNVLGLIPAPNTSPTESYTDTDLYDTNQEITDAGNASVAQSFTLDSLTSIAAARFNLSKIGNPAGNLYAYILSSAGLLLPNGTSEAVPVADVEVWYEWVVFRWQRPPVGAASTTYLLAIGGDSTYQSVYATGTNSVVWACDGSSPTYTDGSLYTYNGAAWSADTNTDALFEIHPLRNDILVDSYRYITETLSSDSDTPSQHARYHEDIVLLATAQALRKDSYDLTLATDYQARAEYRMLLAKAHVAQPTRGRRSRGVVSPRLREGSIVVNNP